MRDDEIAMIVCHSSDAKYLLAKKPEIRDALIITDVVPIGHITIIPKQEFLDYLNESESVMYRRGD